MAPAQSSGRRLDNWFRSVPSRSEGAHVVDVGSGECFRMRKLESQVPCKQAKGIIECHFSGPQHLFTVVLVDACT